MPATKIPRSILGGSLLIAPLFLSGCGAEAKFHEWALEIVGAFQAHPYSLVFSCLFICGLGVPLPEEFFLIMAGYVSFKEGLGWHTMALVTMFSIIGGDSVTYTMGRILRGRITELRLFRRLVTTEHLDQASKFLARHGNKTIFAVRFMPGIRMPTYLMCGILGVRYSVFFMYDGMASLISAPIQVFLAWHYGEVLEDAIGRVVGFNRMLLYGVLVTGLILYVLMHFGYFKRHPVPGAAEVTLSIGDEPLLEAPPVDLPEEKT